MIEKREKRHIVMNKFVTVIFLMMLCLFITIGMSACDDSKTPGVSADDTSETTASGESSDTDSGDIDDEGTALNIVKNGVSEFKIIYGAEDVTSVINSVRNLRTRIKTHTDIILPRIDDAQETEENAPEILIGETNRPETKEVKESLPENSYAIRKVGNSLVIVGTTADMTVLAMYDFEEKILNNPEKCKEGSLKFDEGDNILVTRDAPLKLIDKIKGGYSFAVSSKLVIQTSKEGKYGIGQGICTDGTHVYFALRDADDTGVVIKKHLLSTGELVAKSEPLDLGHANDMSYDTKNKRIVVIHGVDEPKELTVVDPETLTSVMDVTTRGQGHSITYNAERNIFATGNGSKIHLYDENFEYIKSLERQMPDYLGQGMGSDKELIMFNLSGDDNIIETYDWDGNNIGVVHIPMSLESESMIFVDGKYYIAYNKDGERLYETSFDIIFD